ncbi:signal peptidase I [Shewanella sp. GD03713]|uniref:signal peptidase I n=1 Tax=Shewanella sp. GD03713 TaxID=2975372 RepID=UPI0024493DAC|nr:signal peptidase I [Shewanella sp. GD03713]MDH1472556.1 signal peptidase I [Shewanella sp. GD03713]
MVNFFNLLLLTATVVTGIIYLLDVYVWKPARVAESNYLQEKIGDDTKVVMQRPVLVQWLCILFPVLVVVVVLRTFAFETYRIPSESMQPTYLIGDKVLIKKFAYSLHEPLFHRMIWKIADPQRGDVAVFRLPDNPGINYIKRVVGTPGDTVIYKGKDLKVLSADGQEVKYIHDGYTTEIDGAKPERIESFFVQDGHGKGEWSVPDDQYFVIGDNRDNSQDSRFWGFVPRENFVGKAILSY